MVSKYQRLPEGQQLSTVPPGAEFILLRTGSRFRKIGYRRMRGGTVRRGQIVVQPIAQGSKGPRILHSTCRVKVLETL